MFRSRRIGRLGLSESAKLMRQMDRDASSGSVFLPHDRQIALSPSQECAEAGEQLRGRRASATPSRTQSAVPYAARFLTPSTRYEERAALPTICRIAIGALRRIRFAHGHSQTENCSGSNALPSSTASISRCTGSDAFFGSAKNCTGRNELRSGFTFRVCRLIIVTTREVCRRRASGKTRRIRSANGFRRPAGSRGNCSSTSRRSVSAISRT